MSNILARDPLPDVREVFNVVSRVESHRGLHPGSGSGFGNKVQPAAFVVKTNNYRGNDFKKGNNSSANRGPNPNLLWVTIMEVQMDLNLIKTVGTGSEAGGLYLFDVEQNSKFVVGLSISTFVYHAFKQLWHSRLSHPADQVLSILSKTIRLPSFVLSGASPYLLVYGKEPSLSHIRCFGCLCYSVVLNNHDKFTSRDVTFCETIFPLKMQSKSVNDKNVNERDHSSGDGNEMAPEKVNSPHHVDKDATFVTPMNENNIISEGQQSETNSPRSNNEAQNITNIGDEPQTKRNSKTWNEKLTSVLNENGFVQSTNDYSLFVKHDKVVILALLVYVDDIVVTGNNLEEIVKFKEFLASKFQIKDLGSLKYFLGIEVLENKHGMCLSHRKYCLELLSEYGLLACKPTATPMQHNVSLSHIETEKDKRLKNVFVFQKLVGKSIYLSVTRPDISYDVHCLSQYMHSPLQSHFAVGLRVLKYLKQSPRSRVYVFHGNKLSLHAYSDADRAKCLQQRLSIDACHILLVSTSAIQIAANPVFHEKTKHFEIDVHLVREKVASGAISTVMVDSATNLADVFTKGLSISQHKQFCLELNMVDMFEGLKVFKWHSWVLYNIDLLVFIVAIDHLDLSLGIILIGLRAVVRKRRFAVCFPGYNVQSCCTAGPEILALNITENRVLLIDKTAGKLVNGAFLSCVFFLVVVVVYWNS
ncbi:ribonuclease H-like domain-containing protein [Tanacetum coccineum]|uniref:Ribonuclease H-like domain-containing protein n=1 Tax=Tanacetum coccineum TaxID=301880 RepID=A0ABQ5HPP5_9ASTR